MLNYAVNYAALDSCQLWIALFTPIQVFRLHLHTVGFLRHTVQAFQAVEEKMRPGLQLIVLEQRVFLLGLICIIQAFKLIFLLDKLRQGLPDRVIFLKIAFGFYSEGGHQMLLLVNKYRTMYFCAVVDLNCYFEVYPVESYSEMDETVVYSEEGPFIVPDNLKTQVVSNTVIENGGRSGMLNYAVNYAALARHPHNRTALSRYPRDTGAICRSGASCSRSVPEDSILPQSADGPNNWTGSRCGTECCLSSETC